MPPTEEEKRMENKEYDNSYVIPANYTDSGKILGGILSLRNLIEAVVLIGGFGFIELKLILSPLSFWNAADGDSLEI